MKVVDILVSIDQLSYYLDFWNKESLFFHNGFSIINFESLCGLFQVSEPSLAVLIWYFSRLRRAGFHFLYLKSSLDYFIMFLSDP